MFTGIAIFHVIVQITIHFIARNRLLLPDYPFRIFITPKKIDVIGKKINAAPARQTISTQTRKRADTDVRISQVSITLYLCISFNIRAANVVLYSPFHPFLAHC